MAYRFADAKLIERARAGHRRRRGNQPVIAFIFPGQDRSGSAWARRWRGVPDLPPDLRGGRRGARRAAQLA
jgi:hypothetical protein